MKQIDHLNASDFMKASRYADAKLVQSIVKALPDVCAKYKVDPAYCALGFGQIAVESDHFKTMEEYASGAAYEGRRDLGNTQKGDGKRFKGAGLIQRTGRTNHTLAAERLGVSLDVLAERLKTDGGFALEDAFHYCMVERGSRMVKAKEQEDIKILTRAVNGGTTHHTERVRYTRLFFLLLLGYGIEKAGIQRFQSESSHYTLAVDGVMGPGTEKALWKEIKQCEWRTMPATSQEEEKEEEEEETEQAVGTLFVLLIKAIGRMFKNDRSKAL